MMEVWRRLGAMRVRLRGIPRTAREVDRSLQLLATLRDLGWQRSLREGPVDASGSPLPWFSYPAIAWLAGALRNTDRLLEYGGGHSTVWFCQRVQSVVTIEHDAAWAERLRLQAPQARVVLRDAKIGHDDIDASSPYVRAIDELADGSIDIVVIDGVQRPACALAALDRLASSGLMIFDDTHRSIYQAALAELAHAGLWRIDFEGVSPGVGTLVTTSVLGRTEGSMAVFDRILRAWD